MTSYLDRSRRTSKALTIVGVLLILIGALGVSDTAFARDREGDSQERATRSEERDVNSRWRSTTRDERRALRKAARDRWERATPRERRVFRRGVAGLRIALPDFTELERVVLVRALFAMPEAERDVFRKRLRTIDDLDEGQRRELVAELRHIANSPKAELEQNVGRWKSMSESDRDDYRERMRRFRSLSFEERKKLLDEWEKSDRLKTDAPKSRDDR